MLLGLVFQAVLAGDAVAAGARVRWFAAQDSRVTGYAIYVRLAGSPYGGPVAVVAPALAADGTQTYTLQNLDPTRVYYFSVSARTQNGETELAPEISLGKTDPCVVDLCISPAQCAFWVSPDGEPCDDGFFCNGAEICVDGVCHAGSAPDCSDGVGCTVDACDESLGRCRHDAKPGCCTNSAQCADSDLCTQNESCIGGRCISTPQSCPQLPCARSTCDPQEGCITLPVWDGEQCDAPWTCTGEGCGTCGHPVQVPPWGGIFTGQTSGTSALAGGCGAGAAPELVYSWTPEVSGTALIDTCGGTAFDSVLSVWRGDCATGSPVACNDDACADAAGGRHASRMSVPVIAGESYRIAVDGYGTASGNFVLTVTPPSACTMPIVIPPAGGVFRDVTVGVSTLSSLCAGEDSPEKVFQWTPATSGLATIDTCGAGTTFDTILYVRQGSCGAGAEVCNDDACVNASGRSLASRQQVTVTAGTTYFIVVDGYLGAAGPFTLNVKAP